MMHQQLETYINNEIVLSSAEMKEVLAKFQLLHVSKQEWLLKEGDINRHILFVCSGCLRIYFLQDDGEEATRYLAFENQFATGLVSFISQQPSHEYIQALEPTHLLFITHSDFMKLLTHIPAWETFYRRYLEKAYVTNTNRLMSFTTQDAASRYRQLLQEQPAIVERLPNKMVASYLNISQETLSRIKAKR